MKINSENSKNGLFLNVKNSNNVTINFEKDSQAELMQKKENEVQTNVKRNFEIIEKAKVKENDFSKIQNLNHIEQIQNFIKNGVSGTNEIAEFVCDLLPKIIEEPNYSKRKEIELAVEFLKEANQKQKAIVI